MLILSLNVRAGGASALSYLLKWMDQHDPDLLTLQEMRESTVAAWRSALRSRGYVVHDVFGPDFPSNPPAGDSQRRDGLLMASRWPVRLLDPTRLKAQWPERILSVIVKHPQRTFELHTTHVPNGSAGYRNFKKGDGGVRLEKKIDTLEGIHRALTRNPDAPRILTGDFNEPLAELPGGGFRYWNEDPKCPKELQRLYRSRWRAAGEAVFERLPAAGVRDVYREHNGFAEESYSWAHGSSSSQYRYDHMFASPHFAVKACSYDHGFREKSNGTSSPSDHAAIWAALRFA